MTSALVFLSFPLAAALFSLFYFRRVQMARPGLGVMNLGDVAFMLVAVILVPFFYVWLPPWLLTVVLAVSVVSLLYFVFEPVLPRPAALLLAAGLPLGSYLLWRQGPAAGYFLYNNLINILLVAGIVTLWTQSGMKARDAAIFGMALAVYDLAATGLTGVMAQLMAALEDTALVFMLAWPLDPADPAKLAVLGIGDALMLSVFPLVLWKAYGPRAGRWGLALGLAGLLAVMALPTGRLFPVMVVLGPLMGLQVLYWRRTGEERTYRAYREAERRP